MPKYVDHHEAPPLPPEAVEKMVADIKAQDAFLDCAERLRKAGIAPIGGGKDIEEARAPAILERNGTRIALKTLRAMHNSAIGGQKTIWNG